MESPQDLANWVADVFLERVPQKVVKKVGDSDGDGVTDDWDRCPDTPVGAPVNDKGCWMVDNIEFDFNKFNIKSEFVPTLVEIADVMKDNPMITVRINGHTDNIGSEKYNMELGQKRAMAARQFLIDQGVDAERLSTDSFGYSRPAATNGTEWGRARNRRDEFKWSR